jgi:predicted RNase H-like nuclease (RuvC/YqgF family)
VIAKNHLEQERRASSDRDGKLKALSRECQALTESELSLRQTLHQKNTEISHLHQQLRRVVEEQHESKSSMTNTIEEDEIQMQSEGVVCRKLQN